MAIRQVSVYAENKMGTLDEMIQVVSDAGINIRACMVADTADFGILRMIVSDTDTALKVLSEKSMVNITKVVALKIGDEAGSFAKVLNMLKAESINIEYVYAFAGAAKLGAYVVLRVDDVEKTEKILKDNGIDTLEDADVAEI